MQSLDGAFGFLQKTGKALMLPVAVLPVAGLLLGIGASRVGGLVSTVIDGVTGYLIPWRCPGPFAEKLEVLLGNPELRTNFSRAAQRSVERFRWSSVGLRIADVYDAAREQRDLRIGRKRRRERSDVGHLRVSDARHGAAR